MPKAKDETKEVKKAAKPKAKEVKEVKAPKAPELTYLKKQIVNVDEQESVVVLTVSTGETYKLGKNSDEYKQYLKENK